MWSPMAARGRTWPHVAAVWRAVSAFAIVAEERRAAPTRMEQAGSRAVGQSGARASETERCGMSLDAGDSELDGTCPFCMPATLHTILKETEHFFVLADHAPLA